MDSIFLNGQTEVLSNMRKGRISNSWRSALAQAHSGSRWLSVTGYLMLFDIALSLAGLVFDQTSVSGAPTWLKPLKFGISTSLFSFTLAFIIGQLSRTRRVGSILGKVIAVALVPEIILIDLQAARHTSSHFNMASRFDQGVYGAMGTLIGVVFAASILLFLVACYERFSDRSLGWAVRLSLLLALIGMSTGALMTLPTSEQLAAAHAKGSLVRIGAHTVGGQDGGASMPITGWSVDHGDLRIAHFLGLHVMQGLLLAWWLTAGRARWSQHRQLRLVIALGISFAAAYALVLWQALRGQPFLHPDPLTWSGWVACVILLIAGLIWTSSSRDGSYGGSASTPQMKGAR